ncbi:hypothetical protein D3A95_08120 [Thermosynechococcus sichuanensis E542]|uniref:GumC family protein n=1 Tax=Thermosynechococcus sichuanensis TaxID=3161974 RepID=UPI0015E4C936|nr:polysaccharide biosynthesis tyrosine autokinase [Thermosynechococcus vestitus]AXY68080.2 hypothetical protein D3A95_08120 [Thermosynechococcus vestitus E542]
MIEESTLPTNPAYQNGRLQNGVYEPAPAVQESDEDEIDLRQLLGGIKRRWKVGVLTAGCVAGLVLVGYFLGFRAYRYSILMQVEAIRQPGARSGAQLQAISDTLQGIQSLPLLSGQTSGDSQTLVQILNSDLVLRPIYEKFLAEYPDELNRENYPYKSFIKSLSITAESPGAGRLIGSSNSKIIKIQFQAKDKDKIRSLLNLLSDYLINFNEQQKNRQIQQNLRYVNNEISKTIRQIEELEQDLRDFRAANRVFSPTKDADEWRSQLTALRQAKSDNESKMDAIQQRFRALEEELGMTPQQALVAVNLSTSPSYTSQLGALRQVEQRLAEQMSLFPANSPMVQQVEAERQQLVQQLQSEARTIAQRNAVNNPENLIGYQSSTSADLITNYITAGVEYESLQRVNTRLQEQIRQVEAQINRTINLTLGFRKIEQRIAAAQQALQLLLQTRQSLQLQIAQQDFAWQLLSDINDEEQYEVTMRLLVALILAMVLGGFSGAVLAIVLDLMDPRFQDLQQVLKRMPAPVIGQVPLTTEWDQFSFNRLEQPVALWGLQHHLPNSPQAFQESFLFLVGRIQQQRQRGIIAITSAEAGAGRTTIALYLALAAASLGQRVLLVDANLREPGLHTALGIANTSGVGELLAGSTPPPYWQGLLQQHSERLWVLTAGQGSGRLSSEVGVALLQEMKAAFDWVILDTPPQLTDSETNRLLTVVDGALLVLRLNHTEREAFTNVCKDYSLNFPNKLLGIVVNGAPTPKTTAKRERESDIPAGGLRQPVSV